MTPATSAGAGAVGSGAGRARWRGRAQEAIEHLERLGSIGPGVRGVAVATVPDLVEAAVRAGRPELGAERLPPLLSWAEAGAAEPRALARRCQALLAGGDEASRMF